MPKNNEQLFELYEKIGNVFYIKGEYETATEIFEKMKQFAVNNNFKMAKINLLKSKISTHLANYNDASNLLNESSMNVESLPRDHNTLLIIAEIQVRNSEILKASGKFDSALKSGEDALKTLLMIKSKDKIMKKNIDKIECSAIMNLAAVYFEKAEFNKAIEFCKKAYDIANEYDEKHFILSPLVSLGALYISKGEFIDGKEITEKGLEIASTIGDKYILGVTNLNLGNIHFTQGNYSGALKFLSEALRLFDELGNKFMAGKVCGNLGWVYFILGDIEKAISLGERYLNISKEQNNTRGIGIASHYLGSYYMEKGEYNKAENLLNNAREILEELGIKASLIVVLNRLCELEIEKSKHEKKDDLILEKIENAKNYVIRAANLSSETGFKSGEYTSLINLAGVYSEELSLRNKTEKEELIKKARCCYERALKLTEEMKNDKFNAEVFFEFGKFLKSINNKQYKEYIEKSISIYKKIGLEQKIEEVKKFL